MWLNSFSFATECKQGLLFWCYSFSFSNRQFFLPQVSSQHPYAEQYIGRPHVITIDYNNTEEFDATIREILKINVCPEFSVTLTRKHVFLKTQRQTVTELDTFPADSTHF